MLPAASAACRLLAARCLKTVGSYVVSMLSSIILESAASFACGHTPAGTTAVTSVWCVRVLCHLARACMRESLNELS